MIVEVLCCNESSNVEQINVVSKFHHGIPSLSCNLQYVESMARFCGINSGVHGRVAESFLEQYQ